jgi:hypothetical protein
MQPPQTPQLMHLPPTRQPLMSPLTLPLRQTLPLMLAPKLASLISATTLVTGRCGA